MTGRGNETFEHTADMGVRGWGPDPGSAISEAAMAMFSLMMELDGVMPDIEAGVSAEGVCLEELLVDIPMAYI